MERGLCFIETLKLQGKIVRRCCPSSGYNLPEVTATNGRYLEIS